MSALVTLLALGFAGPQPAPEPVIPRPLWYGPQPQSPRLAPGRYGLDFNLLPARGTIALFAAVRLPGRYAAIYGGRIAGAVEIVAIDIETGRLYHRNAERPGSVPLVAAMNPSARPGGTRAEDIEAWFNADLRAHLGLPPHRGAYAVFLWLDDTASPVREARLPGPEGAGHEAAPAGSAGVSLRRSARTPAAASGRVALRAAGQRVYGALAPDLAKSPAAVLTLMALDFRSRALGWRAVPLRGGESAFDLDPAALLGRAGRPSRIFVAAAAGQALSNVVVVQP